MRDRNPVLLGAALFAVASAPLSATALADGGYGPYVGLKVGGAAVEDGDADGVEIEYDTGFAIGAQVGYQFDIFRLEGEFAYQGIEGVSETDVNSDVDIGRFTLNGYVDIPITPNLGPYVGGGFGVANLSADDDFEDDDSAFTYHVETGLNVNVNDQFSIGPFYRYQWIDTDLGQQSDPLVSHLFGVSLRYLLTWRGRARDDRYYRGDYYDRGGYGGAYGSYRSYDRFDRYDRYDHHHHRDRGSRRKSPAEKERDRCGWKGPGCEEEESEGWGG